jgi:hypothetical protein
MNKIRIILFLGLISCQPKDNLKHPEDISEDRKDSIVYPKSENEITNGGIGKLRLGEPFDSIEYKYPNVDTVTLSGDGIEWTGKRINIGKDEWILAENNYNSSITRLSTNSPRIKTYMDFMSDKT